MAKVELRGDLYIVRGRTFIELSNGDRYVGIWFALWVFGDFVTLIGIGLMAMKVGRWTYLRSAVVQRIIARFAQAIEAK